MSKATIPSSLYPFTYLSYVHKDGAKLIHHLLQRKYWKQQPGRTCEQLESLLLVKFPTISLFGCLGFDCIYWMICLRTIARIDHIVHIHPILFPQQTKTCPILQQFKGFSLNIILLIILWSINHRCLFGQLGFLNHPSFNISCWFSKDLYLTLFYFL